MSKKEKEIRLKVILKIGEVEHILTSEEVKLLGLIIESITKKEQPNTIPWFPITPIAPQPVNPYPWRPWWDIVYCGDNITITSTTGKVPE